MYLSGLEGGLNDGVDIASPLVFLQTTRMDGYRLKEGRIADN
jgi:hypothetical protein